LLSTNEECCIWAETEATKINLISSHPRVEYATFQLTHSPFHLYLIVSVLNPEENQFFTIANRAFTVLKGAFSAKWMD